MKLLSIVFVCFMLLAGCAGPNPNPGERMADVTNKRGDYARSLSYIRPAAERGEPWAQLRLGVYYELGVAVEKDVKESISWYSKAAVQQAEDAWANGVIVGALGKPGYFSQNIDALIAQHQLANIYFRGDGVQQDLIKAYLLANQVSKESNGESLFYCCPWQRGGGQVITAEKISETLSNIINAMTPEQKAEAEVLSEAWSPQNGL